MPQMMTTTLDLRPHGPAMARATRRFADVRAVVADLRPSYPVYCLDRKSVV